MNPNSQSDIPEPVSAVVPNLRVIIPAAGGGTRLKPHTHTTPKVMLHVAGKPIIGHIFDYILPLNPEEVVVVVGAQREQIEQYLRASYQLKLRFVEQTEPKGLGHAVAQARDCVEDHPVLILLGDTIVDMDLTRIVGPENALAVRVVENPRRFGVVETKDGLVSHVVEKPAQPKSNLAIVGVYYFTNCRPLFAALDELIQRDKRTRGEYQLTDALQIMVQKGIRIRPYTVEHWLDCGTPEALLETNRYLLQTRNYATERSGVVIVPPVYIEDSASIEASIIGPNASIGAQSRIVNSVVRNSIINEGAEVENAVLENSILGRAAKYQGRALHLSLGDSSEMKSG